MGLNDKTTIVKMTVLISKVNEFNNEIHIEKKEIFCFLSNFFSMWQLLLSHHIYL